MIRANLIKCVYVNGKKELGGTKQNRLLFWFSPVRPRLDIWKETKLTADESKTQLLSYFSPVIVYLFAMISQQFLLFQKQTLYLSQNSDVVTKLTPLCGAGQCDAVLSPVLFQITITFE